MIKNETTNNLLKLNSILQSHPGIAISVSGGVDSMTLAVLAHRQHENVEMFHAVSPAVPTSATLRVKEFAENERWKLNIIKAGEFSDEKYLQNPVDRCYYCKINLYEMISSHTSLTVMSGTNKDDMGDYRPGLKAAESHQVVHPYVEAGITKEDVRNIAQFLSLGSLSKLPASPCLSSRIETGISIDPAVLPIVDRVEELIANKISSQIVRCRIRNEGIVIEMDEETLRQVLKKSSMMIALRKNIEDLFRKQGYRQNVSFEPYRMGSAFLRNAVHD